MTIGKLSPELWENIFLHFYVNDRAEIYHCCLVSRIFYSVMQGAPLFDTITIRKPKQISQLVSCLTKSVQRAQYVKRLLFKLRLRHPSANAELEEAQDLAAVPFLLNLCPRLRELDKVPLLANRYDNILEATRALRNLRHLTLDCDQPESVTAELLPIALEHIYDLVSSLESDGTVSLMNFTMAPLPDIFLPASLPCITYLGLFKIMFDAASLRALIRSFTAPLSILSLVRLDETFVTWDEIIGIIIEDATRLRKLNLTRTNDVQPFQHDFLAHLKNLNTIYLSGSTLAWDSLQHLGPEIANISIIGYVLAPSELAASLAYCKFDHHVYVGLHSTGYDARARATLKTICAQNAFIKLEFFD